MSDSKRKTTKNLAAARKAKSDELDKMIDISAKDLNRSQVELRLTPWRVTWARQDMVMERQERIIELLEELLKATKKK